MSETETKPNAVDETTQGGGEITNSQRESENPGAEESHADDSEPSQGRTLEQYEAELAAARKKIEDLNKGFTTTSQEAAELRRLNEQYQGALGQFVQREQLNADPLEAAKQRYREARENFDAEAELSALDQINAINRQQATREMLALSRAERQVDQVQQQYGIDPQQLADFHRNMDADLIAKAMLIKQGRYEEFSSKEKKAAEQRAREAAAMGRLVGGGSPGTVPGGQDDSGAKAIDDVTFLLYPRDKQKAMIEAGYRVFNNRTGEELDL